MLNKDSRLDSPTIREEGAISWKVEIFKYLDNETVVFGKGFCLGFILREMPWIMETSCWL
jgi:hypothetical protein